MTRQYPTAQLAGEQGKLNLVDLPAVAGPQLQQLPVVLRILLENVVRNMQGAERDQAVLDVLGWLEHGSSEAEIAFQPGRLLMHDTTSTPALVDIAAMRDVLAEHDIDPSVLNPVLPVEVSVDHSLAVEVYAQAAAADENMAHEIRRNQERYQFLRWASNAIQGVRVNPPGTGIMHTINLEQLATVVTTEQRGGDSWLVPDVMLGTDSHTPMINGIGVLGWGVGGLEAQSVMFGMPTMLRIPDVIGVYLTGQLPAGVMATDLALTVTQRLRQLGVSGEFVEFFGPGVATLKADERAVVANMAPEYGASTGYFPIDGQTLQFLRKTGRAASAIEQVEHYARRSGLWFDPEAKPRYSKTIEIQLNEIGMHVAGPRRPQDLLSYRDVPAVLHKELQTGQTSQDGLPAFPVTIAAITSCTNTSDPGLLVAAGLLARKARKLGLRLPEWVKSSFAPGSPAAADYLACAGLIEDLSAVGFDIVGFGCTTCIGNSGPLPSRVQQAMQAGLCQPVAMLSGNRNFPGRIHPDLELGFLMSPPLVIAYALAGDASVNLATEPLQHTALGDPVYLSSLWPAPQEIAELLEQAIEPTDFKKAFAIASANPRWQALPSPIGERFPWNPASTILRRPPFASLEYGSQLGSYTAYPLLVVGDDVTTDHISPASAIPADSMVADFLVARGEDRQDLNVFASRRGNWEVMLRAAFHSKSLHNLLQAELPLAHTIHQPSGEVKPIWEVAEQYRKEGVSTVLVAGERYGTGSSRDWAAKGQRLLGIRAVLAVSFERIHRSNLIGMGILPLRFPSGVNPASLQLQPGDRLSVHADANALQPRTPVEVTILRQDGHEERLLATAAIETQLEVELLREGGVIPRILRHTIQQQRPSHTH